MKGILFYMNEINNIANTTGKATYKLSNTKICPEMEQLYFEFKDNDRIFQVGLKTLLECIIFATKENQLPNLPVAWYTEVCSRYDIPISELLNKNE